VAAGLYGRSIYHDDGLALFMCAVTFVYVGLACDRCSPLFNCLPLHTPVQAVLGFGLVYGGGDGVTWNKVDDEVRLTLALLALHPLYPLPCRSAFRQ